MIKKYCIEFEREFEGVSVIHVDTDEDITIEDAVVIIQTRGYKFNPNYDRVRAVYTV